MDGIYHSLLSMGTADGPGVRYVVFLQGCPLRCTYCHNPDSWEIGKGTTISVDELMQKILSVKEYIKAGGVTVSGGEPLLQAEFVTELFTRLKAEGIHTALDTSGSVMNTDVISLLSVCDLVILDIKMTNEDDYRKYIRCKLSQVVEFLGVAELMNVKTWIRQVIVPDINDNDENIERLNKLIAGYSCIEKVELLPFKKLCLEKYQALGLDFPLKSTAETSADTINRLTALITQN